MACRSDLTRRSGLLPHPLPVCGQGPTQCVVAGGAAEAAEYDDVDPAKRVCMVSETLSHQTLDAVSTHGTANDFFAYGDAEAWNVEAIITRQHGEEAIT